MTTNLTIGGLRVADLPVALSRASVKAKAGTDKFWSSAARPIDSRRTEVLELRLGARRNVNSLAFEVSRFPLVLTVEWQDKSGDWKPFRYRQRNLSAYPDLSARRDVPGQPVMALISNSVPRRITNRSTETGHPQHFGKKHWLRERWKVNPVTTDRVRFRLKRNHRGDAPVGPNGSPVAYSVAMRNIKVGFRVDDPTDVPQGGGDLGSGTDLLDNSVLYSLYRQGPERAIDGDLTTAWLSEPQPINFAVVNYVLDTRDSNGDGEIIDSFYVDPLTPGVHINLYHSDEDPTGDFLGSNDAVPAIFRTEVGNPVPYTPPGAALPLWQAYGPTLQTGVGISSGFVRLDLSQPWWVGIDLTELGDPATEPDQRPILSLAGNMLWRDGSSLTFTLQSGDSVSVPIDQEVWVTSQRIKIVLAYVPEVQGVQDANVRLAYGIDGFDPQVGSLATSEFTSTPASVRVGLHPDPASALVSSMGLRGLTIKTETWTQDSEDWFLQEGDDYVADDQFTAEARQTNVNAVLRVHPEWVTIDNAFGIVGGNDERLSTGVTWTPVPRDYTLRKGFIHLPPTKAKYWKFEFTQLAPHVYEASQTILRTVQIFPASVVAMHSQIGAGANANLSSGPVSNTGDPTAIGTYVEALNLLRSIGVTDATPADASALVIKDPQQAADVASVGWIWQYQPWHMGALSPGWPVPARHQYEMIPLKHSSKVAYFVGVKEITPYRTDFTTEDDTPEYVEHFLDDTYLDETTISGFDLTDNGLVSNSSYSVFTSKTMASYRTVRGVQFATVQTGKYEVLPDPTFVDPDLSHFYAIYGDASVDWVSEGFVEVQRGWIPVTYSDLEQYTYADLESMTYGQMEGGLAPGGRTEGGLMSQPYSPIGEGRLDAEVTVSASTDIDPVTVEIVSFDTGDVLAEQTVRLKAGTVTQIGCQFTAGAVTTRHTYADWEASTYADMEAFTYAELEADLETDTRIYVRVRQAGDTQDSFRIHKIGLYADPIVWSFSADGGTTWFTALDVKNDPEGVMILPVPGSDLKWRAEFYQPGATVSALHVRPWYGTRAATVHPAHDLSSIGPTFDGYDHFPDLYDHPIWKSRDTPVETEYVMPTDTTVWRNLAPNPGNEGTDADFVQADGGTVQVDYDWEVEQ